MPIQINSGAKLAIHGGRPVRREPMPARLALGDGERAMISEVLDYYRKIGQDPGYQGRFEDLYCQAFSDFMGGGYADAVATGTAALFVGLRALDLPRGSEVLTSPITDPGSLSAIIVNGLRPHLVDSQPGNYNIGPAEVEARIGPDTAALAVVHAAGQAAPIGDIMAVARKHGLKVLEDCSQAHGAKCEGRLVGTFGDVAAFSTMYRKAHITGGSGGIVFSRNREIYHKILAHADRGKPRWSEDFSDRNPAPYLYPALNLNADEISCAIGIASLARLPDTIRCRLKFISALDRLKTQSIACSPYGWSDDDSPFFYPIRLDTGALTCDKITFAEAVRAEGIDLNPQYQFVVADWPWVTSYLAASVDCVNARRMVDTSFNLYLNENYGDREVADTLAAIEKVENHYAR